MSLNYNLVRNGNNLSITVFVDGEMYVADRRSHGNIKDIVGAAIDGDEARLVNLLDVRKGLADKFERLTERVTVKDKVYLDGDPAPEVLSNEIMRHYEAGWDFTPLVNFLERLANNPNPDSVEQLYAWIESTGGITIDEDGYLIAYKGVSHENGQYLSIHSGQAIVDGEVVKGRIPNAIGSVIEMPRSEVQFDPSVGCSRGLHAGVWSYASGFGNGAVLEVRIDPRDVVSVPHDSSAQKVRVCRYEVLDTIDVPHSTPLRGRFVEDEFGWGELDDEFFFDHDGWGL